VVASEPAELPRAESELLDDGRGPETAPRWPGPADRPRLSGRGRAALATLAVAALAVAVVGATTQHPAAKRAEQVERAPSSGPSSPAGIARTPAPDVVQLLDDQYRAVGDKGEVTLDISVINYGAAAVDVLQTRLPQLGARPESGPGGDLPFAAPITLVPDRATLLTVLARVSCPSVLTAPLADHVDVTLGRAGHAERIASLSIASLGTALDDARHAACGQRSASGAIYPTMVPGSVRLVPGPTDGRPLIVSQLQLKNLDNGETTVSIAGADPSGVSVGTDGPVTLPAARTEVVEVTWRVNNCGQLAGVRWPTLVLSVQLATSSANNTYGFDDTFGAAWRTALREVCPGIT